MNFAVGRREFLALGSVALAGALLPMVSVSTSDRSFPDVILFDPTIPLARELAEIGKGSRTPLVALHGDLVHLWRRVVPQFPCSISGVTRWSDFVLFRGLGAEQRMRVRREQSVSSDAGRFLFAWNLS